MNILTAENISKGYSERQLFENTNFGINEGDKIGIIGINGTGKSTLLKVLSGIESADKGQITINSKFIVEYLSQNPEMDEKKTVIQQVFDGGSKSLQIVAEYEELLNKIENNPENQNLSEKLIKISDQMDKHKAWDLENKAKIVLTKLGVTNFEQKIGDLSGGQKKRVALARALIKESDLLILDEPTNHLDSETIQWLEDYLNNNTKALLMITHDRYFLDRVTNRIFELDRSSLYSYKGNYSEFLEQRSERIAMEEASESKLNNLYKRELAWIKRGAKARTTKQKARIQRFEQLSETEFLKDNNQIEISTGSSRLGNKILTLNNVSKKYDNKKLFDEFEYIFVKKDRIGIVGKNGAGKTTLMNIMAQRIKPDIGFVEKGETVKIGYYAQENEEMNPQERVIEYIRKTAEYITTSDGEKISASSMLERFLFSPEKQWTLIERLSGGEKRRLYLLNVLMQSPNVLFLDEPTNDLDVQTLSILEDYIDNFEGVVVVVSHDRYFLDRICDKIFSIENRKIKEYHGNYSDYKEKSDEILLEEQEKKKPKENNNSNKIKQKALKFTYNEQREYEMIDEVIQSIEKKLENIEQIISTSGSDFTKLQEAFSKKEVFEKELDEKMQRWVYLNELAEKIENQKN